MKSDEIPMKFVFGKPFCVSCPTSQVPQITAVSFTVSLIFYIVFSMCVPSQILCYKVWIFLYNLLFLYLILVFWRGIHVVFIRVFKKCSLASLISPQTFYEGHRHFTFFLCYWTIYLLIHNLLCLFQLIACFKYYLCYPMQFLFQ